MENDKDIHEIKGKFYEKRNNQKMKRSKIKLIVKNKIIFIQRV